MRKPRKKTRPSKYRVLGILAEIRNEPHEFGEFVTPNTDILRLIAALERSIQHSTDDAPRKAWSCSWEAEDPRKESSRG